MKFIDLFAGLGGIRLGFEQACQERNIETECVLTSEIKPYAVQTLKHNHSQDNIVGDIFQVKNEDIPDFDFLFGGDGDGGRLGFYMSQADCEKLGGHKAGLKDVYMVHDWVVPGWECSWGVFAPECPELGGRTGGTACSRAPRTSMRSRRLRPGSRPAHRSSTR